MIRQNLSAVISDAPEDSWIPGAQYVQGLAARRGGGADWAARAFGRRGAKTSRDTIIISASCESWIRPTDWSQPENFTTPRLDFHQGTTTIFFQRELDLVRRRGGFDLERHHLTPLEFADRFRGLWYRTGWTSSSICRELHTGLRPDGLPRPHPTVGIRIGVNILRSRGSRQLTSEELLTQLMKNVGTLRHGSNDEYQLLAFRCASQSATARGSRGACIYSNALSG